MNIYDYNGNLYIPKKEISILFIGNSLMQDGVSYIPYVLSNIFPEINYKIYIWYNGGYTLAQQYNKFISNGKADIFSVAENYISWTNYNASKTMTDVLNEFAFDIVCMQEFFTSNVNTNYSINDLVHWTNCINYITSHYNKNPLMFMGFAHSVRSTDIVYNNMLNGLSIILKNTIAEDIFPNGIAIKYAMNTELNNLGDAGKLSNDGTHSQEGLPCLLEGFCGALWIANKLGIAKSVYNSELRITTAIQNTLHIPGANMGSGVITGTDSENLLAQECAIQGFKYCKKFVIDHLM